MALGVGVCGLGVSEATFFLCVKEPVGQHVMSELSRQRQMDLVSNHPFSRIGCEPCRRVAVNLVNL